MSDILIKGVSFEDFKPICPCMNGDYGCCNIPGVKRCYGIGKDGCPLAELPPHGDLIDRKALLADTTDMLHSIMVFGGARVYTSDAIKNAPTVIPEEEGET